MPALQIQKTTYSNPLLQQIYCITAVKKKNKLNTQTQTLNRTPTTPFKRNPLFKNKKRHYPPPIDTRFKQHRCRNIDFSEIATFKTSSKAPPRTNILKLENMFPNLRKIENHLTIICIIIF